MFRKKACPKCGKKLNDHYQFCPYCGNNLRNNENDWGMLGRDDFLPQQNEMQFPTGFNALFNTLVKNLNKQFNELSKEQLKNQGRDPKMFKKNGISITMSTFNGKPQVKVRSFGNEKPKQKKAASKTFSKEKMKKFSGLEKQEAKTNIRRLSDRVIYELEMPGVESIEDVSILRLESSVEIKAISENTAYTKIIPLNLPLINYYLEEEKLVLELEGRN